MSKQQKVVANFVLDGGMQTTFLTAKQIAATVGVSPATVVRFIRFLGYASFNNFSDELKQMMISNYTPMKKLRESVGGENNDAGMLALTSRYEAENIEHLVNLHQDLSFDKAVDLLLSARRIFLVGARSAYAVVYYAGFLLRDLVDNVRFFPSGSEMAYEELESLSPKDVLISVCFPRYAKRTVELTAFAASKEARIVAITDGAASPIRSFAQVELCAPNVAPFYSYVAAMTVMDALVWAFAKGKKGQIEASLEKRFQMLLENDVFF